jgi:hypothetical protein
METIAIMIIALLGLYSIGESIYYRRRLKDAETAYKDLCRRYNLLRNDPYGN